MSDEKRQSGSSEESRGLSRRDLVTGGGLFVAAMATGCSKSPTPSSNAVAALTPSRRFRRTLYESPACPPPLRGTSEEAQAVVQLDQSDDAPPFGAFLGACNTDSDCSDGNTCNSFRKRGNHCTHSCEAASDCKGAAEPRCTKQNRCGLIDPVKTK